MALAECMTLRKVEQSRLRRVKAAHKWSAGVRAFSTMGSILGLRSGCRKTTACLNVPLAKAGRRWIAVAPYAGRAHDRLDPEFDRLDPDFIAKGGGDGECRSLARLK